MGIIFDEAVISEVHYILTYEEDGYEGGYLMCRSSVYAVSDGYGEEISRHRRQNNCVERKKILGVIQRNDGKWEVCLGSLDEDFFGERPFKTPCGLEPEVCCKYSRYDQRTHAWLPFASWDEATCKGCGQREPVGTMPTPDWSEGVYVEIGIGELNVSQRTSEAYTRFDIR